MRGLRGLAGFILPATLGVIAICSSAAAGPCPEVTWTGPTGDWSDGPSWSGGVEPTGTDCAFISGPVTVGVTAMGETCAALTLGMTGAQPTNMQIWPGGSLDIVGLLYIGDGSTGNIGQLGGISTVGTLEIVRGGYAMGNGTFTVGSVTLGGQSYLASIATSDGTTSVTGNLDMLANSVITLGSGTVTVGGTATVGGRLAVTGRLPDLIQVAALTMVPGGVIAPFVTSNGVDAINVTGTAQLTGTLSVTDFSAMNGTWDVLVAGDLQGTFSAVQLPDANWSWGIDGNRVWIAKGAGSPVEAASWSAVKSEYRTGAR